MNRTRLALSIGTVLASLPLVALAQTPKDEPTVHLGTLIVTTNPYAQELGTQRIHKHQLNFIPKGNGNITELLKTNPNVSFSSTADNSQTNGEIAPNEISFHGEKFYNNNFTIDGLSNNDNLNPASNMGSGNANNINQSGQNPWELPAGGTQSFWLPTELIKTVNVYDSNVSAKYGNFTGGVVDAELADPSKKMSGKISYRTARSDWDKQHIAESKQADFDNQTSIAHQKQYTKHEYSLFLNQPISERLGLIFGYNRITANIPFRHSALRNADQATATLDNTYWDDQERKNETYFLKGKYELGDNDIIKASLFYSPHTSNLVRPNIDNGRYTNTGGGYRASLDWKKHFATFSMQTLLSYNKTGNEIEHSGDNYHSYRLSPSVPYRSNGAVVNSGGSGTFSTQKSTLTAKQAFDFDPFGDKVVHNVSAGWQFDHGTAEYKRDNPLSLYTYTTTNANRLTACADACILGEQYANRRFYYDARQVKVNDSIYSAYAEDKMQYNNLELTAGLRVDYGKFYNKPTISPRLSFAYDVFGNQNSRVFGGANRYYGNSMLANKFRQHTAHFENQTRTLRADGTLSDWTTTSTGVGGSTRYANNQVKAPYSDEWNVGINQKIFGTNLTAKWVHRESKNELTRSLAPDGSRILANNGWSKNDSYTLSLSPVRPMVFKHANIHWGLDAQYAKRTTNNSYYDDNEFFDSEKAYLNGEIIDSREIEPADYFTPKSVGLSVNTQLPKYNVSFGQRLKYTGSRMAITSDGNFNCATAIASTSTNTIAIARKNACLSANETGDVAVYNEREIGSKLLLDWRLSYQYPLTDTQKIGIDLDINNVLDNKTGLSDKRYTMGRNFWLGVNYSW